MLLIYKKKKDEIRTQKKTRDMKEYLHVSFQLLVDCRLEPSDLVDREASYLCYVPVTNQLPMLMNDKSPKKRAIEVIRKFINC